MSATMILLPEHRHYHARQAAVNMPAWLEVCLLGLLH
jgi:hypothetical protein